LSTDYHSRETNHPKSGITYSFLRTILGIIRLLPDAYRGTQKRFKIVSFRSSLAPELAPIISLDQNRHKAEPGILIIEILNLAP
jgi:hypothetical protein